MNPEIQAVLSGESRGCIVCGDALEIIRQMPDKCVDLVVTSPPYGDLREYGGYNFHFEETAQQLVRLLKDGAVLVWIVGDASPGGNGESGESMRQALYFKSLGLRLHDTMIYEKAGPAYPSRDKYYQVWEYMFVLSRGKPKTFHPLSDRPNRWFKKKFSMIRSRRKKDGSLIISTWDEEQGGEYGVRFNVWRYACGAGYSAEEDYAHEHPAIFPEALAADHILSWSNPGDIVLDPMNGSGTTSKMARCLERRFIASEINPDYCEIARRRIAQEELF
jgi:site-specific DNA-methyltransferase (adenine-specific)